VVLAGAGVAAGAVGVGVTDLAGSTGSAR
jgi:hypothetical protein